MKQKIIFQVRKFEQQNMALKFILRRFQNLESAFTRLLKSPSFNYVEGKIKQNCTPP